MEIGLLIVLYGKHIVEVAVPSVCGSAPRCGAAGVVDVRLDAAAR